MRKLAIFFETERGKRVKNAIIGLGASVVLMGALFKLQHWPMAGALLVIGMMVEAFIFALQGILPPHKDYYWEKLYPDLDVSPEEEELLHKEFKGSAIEQLEQGLKKAEIAPEIIDGLGKSMKKLGDNISKLSDITDASIATEEYSDNARKASQSLQEMKSAYAKATEAVYALASVSEGAETYKEQLQLISKNLSSLNELYELELQESNAGIKTMQKFYDNVMQISNNLNDSIDDTKKYRESVAGLAKNVSALSNVYGNILSAMSGHK